MLPRMNCSVKFFDPTVTDLLALALFFLISFELPPEEEPPPPPPPPPLLLSSLPQAANATASTSADNAATSARIDPLMSLVPSVGIVGQKARDVARPFRA